MPEIAGITYSVYEGGHVDLPPVVLIHGAGGSHLMWPAEIRRLAGQRVIALDLPGHGKSRGFAQQSIPAYADALQAFLSELGIAEAVLVGHSMGGAVALTLALKYPRQVTGLGLISSGAFLGVDALMLEELSNPVTAAAGLARFQQKAFGPDTPLPLVSAVMRPLYEARPSLLLADWLACANFDLRELAGAVQAPTWIACGAQDQVTPPVFSRFLAARLPAAQMQLFPGAGHMLPFEQPRELAQGLTAFLTEQLKVIESYRWVLQTQSLPASRERKL